VNTHLKGQIFQREGASYLVLHEDGESPEHVWVRKMSAERTISLMPARAVQASLQPGGESRSAG